MNFYGVFIVDDLQEIPFLHDSDDTPGSLENHDDKDEVSAETVSAANIPVHDELHYNKPQCLGGEVTVSGLNNKSTSDEELARVNDQNEDKRLSEEPINKAKKRKREVEKEMLCDSYPTTVKLKQHLDVFYSKRRRMCRTEDTVESGKIFDRNDLDSYNSVSNDFSESGAEGESATGDNSIRLHGICREKDENSPSKWYIESKSIKKVLHKRQAHDAIQIADDNEVIDSSGPLSFLETNASVSQSIGFLSDFTLRSQREKYDALEMNYKHGEDESDGLSQFDFHSDLPVSLCDRTISTNESDSFVYSQ